MFVCRTLDYIVNTDLHLYLLVKFDAMRGKGIHVEIELTEPITYIPMDAGKYIEILDMVLGSAMDSLVESFDKKLNFYMFYTEREMHLVLQYAADKQCSSKALGAELRKYKSLHLLNTNEKCITTQHLIAQ